MKTLLYISLFSCISSAVIAQVRSGDETADFKLKAGTIFTSNVSGLNSELPFWLHANRDGTIDQSSANALLYVDGSSYLYKGRDFSVETGGRFISRYSDDSAINFNELYVHATAYSFKLSAGRFIDPLASKEDELSTGSFMISRNATPIPKVAFYTDGFTGVPGTQGIIRYNALFAHGWFEDDRYVQSPYLHQKYFYLSIKYAFFDAVGGIVHNVQWAGESQNPNVGQLPSGWDTFSTVVFARGSKNEDAPGGEQTNAVGNSVAAYDFSLGLFFKDFDMRAYRLFYLEDKVSTRFRSPWDGVWGLTIKPKNIPLVKNFLWEHINTKRQDSFDFEPYGTSRYYNNFIYRTGWTYNRRVIGNPLLLSDGADGSDDYPVYNNIIIGHHFGISGSLLADINFTIKYTFTRNYGVFEEQIITQYHYSECSDIPDTICADLRPLEEVKKINHSFILEVSSTIPNNESIKYGVSLTSDFGELYGDRLGLMVNLEWEIQDLKLRIKD
ncbi:MAG: capsule assembly Wzi family protein [Balneolaceae bacterium]